MKRLAIVSLLLVAACSRGQERVATVSDVAAAARPVPTGQPRVTEGQVATAYSRLESAYDECARRHGILSTTYQAARSRAVPPQE